MNQAGLLSRTKTRAIRSVSGTLGGLGLAASILLPAAGRIEAAPPATAAPQAPPAGPASAGAPQLTLREAMAQARGRSREAAAAAARSEAAGERAKQASAFRLPSLNASEIYFRTNDPAQSFAFQLNKNQFSFPDFVTSNPNDPSYTGTALTRFEAALPLFTGGELSGRIHQAESAAEAAAKSAGWAGDSAALSAAEAYVMLAQAEEYTGLLERANETVRAHVALAKAYSEQGMLVRSEVLRAEVELSRVEDLLEEARGRVRVASANLAFRLGVDQSRSWILAPLPAPKPLPAPDDTVAAWIASAASRRDLLAAKDLLHAGELETKVRSASWYPKLAVVGRYDLYGTRLFGSTGTNGSLMAVATINVFQGGADQAALAAARADLRAGQEDVARFEEGVALGVRQAFEELATARARHATALKALDSARETERITNERFRSGVVKTLDVLDAATARREAETRELVSRAEAQGAALKLALQGGRAPESVLPDVP